MNLNDPCPAPAMVRVTIYHPTPEIVTQWARDNCAAHFRFIPHEEAGGYPAIPRLDRSKLRTGGAWTFEFRLTIDFESEDDVILFRLRWS